MTIHAQRDKLPDRRHGITRLRPRRGAVQSRQEATAAKTAAATRRQCQRTTPVLTWLHYRLPDCQPAVAQGHNMFLLRFRGSCKCRDHKGQSLTEAGDCRGVTGRRAPKGTEVSGLQDPTPSEAGKQPCHERGSR